jgi:hypothetical protein
VTQFDPTPVGGDLTGTWLGGPDGTRDLAALGIPDPTTTATGSLGYELDLIVQRALAEMELLSAGGGGGGPGVQFGNPAAIRVASSVAHPNQKDGSDYVCDGTNDHEEILAALSVAALAGGSVVELGHGPFFCLPDALNVPANTTLRGQGGTANGGGATRIVNAGGTGALLRHQGVASLNRVGGGKIQNLVLDGNTQVCDGLLIKYANSWHVDNVTTYDCLGHGMHLYGGSDSSVTRSRLDWCGSNNIVGAGARAAMLIEDDDGGWANDNVRVHGVIWENNPDRALEVTIGAGANGPYEITFDTIKIETHEARGGPLNDYILWQNANHCRMLNSYFFCDAPTGAGMRSWFRLAGCTSAWVKGNNFSANYPSTDPFAHWLSLEGNTGLWVTENVFQHGGAGVPAGCLNWVGTNNQVAPRRQNYIQNTSTTLEVGSPTTDMVEVT